MSNCQCGGVIREQGKPFFDILRSCTCASPVAVQTPTIITTTTTGTIAPKPRSK
jgi:hypothetical protein